MRRPGRPRAQRPSDPLRVVDVGTGSGAIAVALAVSLRRLGALEVVEILAVDISADALELARENAVSHAVADRIEFARGRPASRMAAARSTSCWPICRTCDATRSRRCRARPRSSRVIALDGGVGRARAHRPAARPSAGRAVRGRDRAARDRWRPGRGHRRARRDASAGLVVRRRDRPGWPAACRARDARPSLPASTRQRLGRRSGIIFGCPRSRRPSPSCPSASSPSTSTGRSSAMT